MRNLRLWVCGALLCQNVSGFAGNWKTILQFTPTSKRVSNLNLPYTLNGDRQAYGSRLRVIVDAPCRLESYQGIRVIEGRNRFGQFVQSNITRISSSEINGKSVYEYSLNQDQGIYAIGFELRVRRTNSCTVVVERGDAIRIDEEPVSNCDEYLGVCSLQYDPATCKAFAHNGQFLGQYESGNACQAGNEASFDLCKKFNFHPDRDYTLSCFSTGSFR